MVFARAPHHLVPKNHGGRPTRFLHWVCHRQIHALLTDSNLARQYETVEALLAHPPIRTFEDWGSPITRLRKLVHRH